MPFETLTPDPAAWDAFVTAHPRAHLLQLSAWGELKSAYGWQPVRVALAEDGTLVAGAQLLLRRLPLRLGRLAYAPYGPLVDWADAEQVRALLAAVDATARQHGAALLKIEPGYGLDDVDFAGWGFRPSPHRVQPPRTYVIDLAADEETLLKRMNQGTRRNIRKSERMDVVVRQGTRADLDSFNALMATTGERADFGVHTPDYYTRLYDLFAPPGQAAIFLGSYAGQDLAAIMVFALGKQSWYFHGASSRHEHKRMASYGVQWAGIQWAKRQGATCYDMVGVPDEDPATLEAQFEQRSDGLWSVYRFKRGWGGEVIRSVGPWDRVYRPAVYAAYNLAARLR